MRAAIAVPVCAILLASSAMAQPITSYGIGLNSCATAFLPENKLQASAWTLGFWSSWNWAKAANVGATTDANGILGEVEIICRRFPSQQLKVAIRLAYDRMQAEGR